MLPTSTSEREILTSSVQEWDYGVDLLDSNGTLVADISSDVSSMQVTHDIHAELHGDCQLDIVRDLAWGSDRVRPWVAVRTSTTDWLRWNLGVFIPTSPETEVGEDPRTRRVQAYDMLWLLRREIGDTYVIPAGVSYLDAIRDVLDDAGVTVTLLLQGDRQTTTLAEPSVWVLGGEYTWLDVINDLLGLIGYNNLWADSEGRLRSEPYQPPSDRGTSWVFDSADILATIMGEQRRMSADLFDVPNLWRFVRNKDQALASSDIYVVDRTSGLPSFQVRPKTVYLDAADSAALVSEGDRIVAEDTAAAQTVEFDLTPLPFEHGDVVEVRDVDLGLTARCVVASYTTSPGTGHVTLEVL